MPPPSAVYAAGRDPYFSSSRLKNIVIFVLIMHATAVVAPFIYFSVKGLIQSPDEIPPAAVRVTLASGDSLLLPPDSVASGETMETPEPLDETPPSPPPPAPVQPEQVKTIPEEPVKQPVPPPPTPKQETKTADKKTVKETKPVKTANVKPAPQKPSVLTAEQIKKGGRTIVKNTNRSNSNTKTNSKSSNSSAAKTLADIRGLMGNSKGTFGDPDSDSRAGDRYLTKLKAFVEPRWREPSETQLGGKKPSVTIELTIDAQGRVTSKRITAASGVDAMDASVNALLAGLNTVPVPPKTLTIPITLRVR